MAFSDKLPSIKRAKMETTLKEEDLRGPFGTDKNQMASAIKVASETAADLILVGSIDDVQVNTDKKTANVTLSAVVANARTGVPVKTVAVTGAVASDKQDITDAELVFMASSDAATKLVREIVPDQPVVIQGQIQGQRVSAPAKKKNSSGIRKFIIPIVVVAAIAIAASGSDSDSDNDDLDGPPPSPL
jgi:hypothetical protein